MSQALPDRLNAITSYFQGGLAEAALRRADEIANAADIRVLPPPEFLNGFNVAAAAASREISEWAALKHAKG